MTIPQQTKFSPVVPQRNTPKSAFKAPTQTLLASSGFHTAEAQQPSTYSKKRSITPPPHLPKKRKKVSHAPPIASLQTDRYESENSDTDQPTTPTRDKFDGYRLIDITPTKPKRLSAPGRPKKTALDIFLRKCFRESQPGKHLYRCVGEGCSITFSNRNLRRTLKHARTCNKLPKHLRLKAKESAAKNALSKKVLDSEAEKTDHEQNQDGVGEVQVARKKTKEDGRLVPTAEWFEEARTLGRDERHKRLDFAILLLICAAGLPTHLVSRPEWRRVFTVADPTYTPATREKLETEHIVSEAENVMAKQLQYLRTQENLTVSCDGGTTKGGEAFWTIHVSTPNRKVYLMECREATSESHTGVWIKDVVLEARIISIYINLIRLIDACQNRLSMPSVVPESVLLFVIVQAILVSLDDTLSSRYPLP